MIAQEFDFYSQNWAVKNFSYKLPDYLFQANGRDRSYIFATLFTNTSTSLK
jgi:hypothetical protein